jgi:hypothetical protein
MGECVKPASGDAGRLVKRGALAIAAAAALSGLWAGPAAAACAPASGAYAAAVLADSPLAYYRLDDPDATTLCDSSATASNGSYASSGVTFGAPGALTSSPDPAVQLGSPSSGIGTGGAGLTGDHSFTLEAWFRRGDTLQNQVLVTMGGSGRGNIAGLATWSNVAGGGTSGPSELGLDNYTTSASWNTAPVGVDIWDGGWHYLVVAYDQATKLVTAFVDDRSLGAETPTPLALAGAPIRLGTWIDTVVNKPFVGSADEIAVYPVALSAAQVDAHFQATLLPPVEGRLVNAVPQTGTVLVKLPSSAGGSKFVRLESIGRQLPVGSLVDATKGSVHVLTAGGSRGSAQQDGHFGGGLFSISQSRKNPLTTISMSGGGLGSCGKLPRGGAPKANKKRRLSARVLGQFRVLGRHSTTTASGAQFSMSDSCAGTLTVVRLGRVVVHDLVKHRSVTLRQGHRYFARRGNR